MTLVVNLVRTVPSVKFKQGQIVTCAQSFHSIKTSFPCSHNEKSLHFPTQLKQKTQSCIAKTSGIDTRHTMLHTVAYLGYVVNKFCTQHDLSKTPIKSDVEQKIHDTYAATDIKKP